ncbi:trichohyalin-like isoform X4 [Asterias rubens]|uniref:trichohyalin-like isoform X4 n=1 Tax=Asterias rubens TaxID=7604 RepID=UPI001455B976|nr:trichohyalin-like isoform X4 [Asterias rubens]
MDVSWESQSKTNSKNEQNIQLGDALAEARRWIERVTGRKFHCEDFRKSMTDGILLCMLMQKIKPGLIPKINKSRSIYAGVDNLNVFLGACEEIGLKAAQLFHPGDLQDLSSRASLSIQERKREEERRLKNVCITVFWLGRTASHLDSYTGPQLSLDAFAPLVHGSFSLVKGLSPDNASSGVSSWASGGSGNNRHSSLGFNDDVFTSDGIDLTSVAPETYSEPQWKRDLKQELNSAVPGLSTYTHQPNSKPVLRMEKSRGRPPPVAAKPLHTRSKSMPERANLERQNSVEDDDSQSYRSGSSGDPMSPTTYDEFVKSKGMMQDDQEVWMSMADAATSVTSVQKSLDSWKSRRRRATHSVLERKASRDEVEQTEHERQRRRSKTYSEMMEEKEKREKILMTMATKNKSLDPEDIVHILTKPALYEDEIKDLPERRPRSNTLPGSYKQGESSSFDSNNPPNDSADARGWQSRQPPPSVAPKPKVRRNGSAFAPYQRPGSRDDVQVVYRNGSSMLRNSYSSEVYAVAPPSNVETLTFKEKLLRDREREIGMTAEQRNSKSSARLPQKKRLSMGILGRVAAFNKGESAFEHETKPKTPAPKEEIRVPEHSELTIHMEQKPRNENGFGFTIIGGSDTQRPIVVTSVTKGSSADLCDLKVGDEIVAINGEKTKTFDNDHAMYCFSSSILTGELTLKIHRYEEPGMRKHDSSTRRTTESTRSTTNQPEVMKRRAVSQPADPRALTQAARAKKILQQMRDEEEKIEDMRREREEERRKPTVNGNSIWNHRAETQNPVRSHYDDPEPEEQPKSTVSPSGPAAPAEPTAPAIPVAPAAPKPSYFAPQTHPTHPQVDTETPLTEDEIKTEVKEVKPFEKNELSFDLERVSPNGEQYGKSIQVGIEILDDEPKSNKISSDRDSVSPDEGVNIEESKQGIDDRHPETYGSPVDVEVELVEETVGKSEVQVEHSVNLDQLLGNDTAECDGQVSPERSGHDGEAAKGSSVETDSPNKSSRLEGYGAILSDGEMFSSEEDERPETDMNRMQRADEEAAPRHRHNEEDPKTKGSMEEDLITPQSKLTEEAPISFKRFSQEESAPPQSQGPRPFQHHTSVDSSKPPTFHPIKFSAPKPFSNRLGPEPFRPASFKPVAMREKGVKQDMMQRRSDFFNDEKDQNDRSGQSSPITALSASSEETVPPPISQEAEESSEIPRHEAKQPASLSSRKAFNVEEEKKRLERWHAEQDRIRQEQYEQEQRRLKEQQEKDLERAEAEERKKKMEEHQRLLVPPPISQEAEESSEIPRHEAKQPASLSSRKAFNVEEEKKRLERWHAEQDRIRQEQYEQEQRRLKEQQEKDLERAEAEERKKKMEEHQRLLEKQRLLQEQAAEERKRLEEERKERTKKEQEFLERARLEREEAERERLDDEEEQRKMAAERMKREEERRMKEQEDKRRLEKEKRAEEEEQRRLEKEEWQQREIERQDQEAEARRLEINRLQEKEKAERLRRKQEEEARLAREHEQKETERFARLRDEEIERIRKEERERLRQEWEELQREKAKQDERERLELERLDELRAEQERLRQERILMEEQQERERRQLQKEKERLMTQSAAFKQPKESTKPMSEEIPYNKPEMESQVLEKENKLQDYDNSVVEKEIIVSQENKDVFSAPPPKNAPAESFQVPGQAYLSQYKDGKMGSQHWLVEEAERRRLAEKNGTMRLEEPVESHTGPIQRKDLDLEPVLEKKSHAPDHVAPIRRSDKPAMIQEPAKPPSREQPKPQSRKETTNQGFREVAVDVPPNFQGVQRRLRAPEVEAERKKKTQNRRSMPDMGNRVPDVVRSESHTPPPVPSDRNSDRMPDNFLQQPQLGPPGRSSAFQQPSKKPAPGRSVSGKVTCSNCAKTLGRGAAMIIESLGLHYHIECFRCCVCNIRLGNGSQGTDVRIRASKLHCQNCYSNDAGFEFTEV